MSRDYPTTTGARPGGDAAVSQPHHNGTAHEEGAGHPRVTAAAGTTGRPTESGDSLSQSSTAAAVRIGKAAAARGRAPSSLRRRLAASVMAIVLLLTALVGIVSTLTVRQTLSNGLDEQVRAAHARAAHRRHGGPNLDGRQTDEKPAAPSGTLQKNRGTEGDKEESGTGREPVSGQPSPSSGTGGSAAGQASEAGDVAEAGEDVESAEPSQDAASSQAGPPVGLDAAGQATGTLIVQSSGAPGNTQEARGGYIDEDGSYQLLSQEALTVLCDLPESDTPTSVDVPGLDTYRVLVSRDAIDGDYVLTGLSMGNSEDVLRQLLLVEIGVVMAAAGLGGVAGASLVRRALAPLSRVARTAEKVADQPLDQGEVSIDERVCAADLASSQEVGQVGRALNTLLDHVDDALTERQRSETQARQFVADASHELRTPLAAIRGYTELIQRAGHRADLPEDAVHALDRVHSESLRMSGLVEDLLLLARLDVGRDLEEGEADLLAIALDTISDAQAAGPDHCWELDLSALEPESWGSDAEPGHGSAAAAPEVAEPGHGTGPGEELPNTARSGTGEAAALAEADADTEATEPLMPVVPGDEERLRQVIVNLLANARVHTPAGTKVTMRLFPEGGNWVIEVNDNGPGISEEMQARLFERFARGDSSRARQTGSTGLGMSIAHAIVTSHGGTLTVISSTEEPSGTTFRVILPSD